MQVINLKEKDFEEVVINSDRPVIVDFYADWCGPCKMMSPIIEDLAKDLGEKVKVTKINVDENQEISIEYGIMSIPTIMIFNQGKKVNELVGVRSKPEIIDSINIL